MISPVERLTRFKATAKEQAARVDVVALLHASDSCLRSNAPETRKQLLDRHRREAEGECSSDGLGNGLGHFDFFSHLGIEAKVDRSLNCMPGSMLPMVASSRFLSGGFTRISTNVSFRSVGYESPPAQPYARQSKAIYQSRIASKKAKERRRQARARRSSPSACLPLSSSSQHLTESLTPKKEISLKLRRHKKPKARSELEQQAPFYASILELHKKAVARARLQHSNGSDASSAVLFERAKLRDQKERRRKQIERWCSDADESIAKVVERERRRLESIR